MAKHLDEKTVDECYKLYNNGLRLEEISRKMDITTRTLKYWITEQKNSKRIKRRDREDLTTRRNIAIDRNRKARIKFTEIQKDSIIIQNGYEYRITQKTANLILLQNINKPHDRQCITLFEIVSGVEIKIA